MDDFNLINNSMRALCLALKITNGGQARLAVQVDVEGSRLELTPGTMRGRVGSRVWDIG